MKLILKKLQNKKIALLGLGGENGSLLNFLVNKGIANITICDKRKITDIKNNISQELIKKLKFRLGYESNKKFDQFDILFRSPGWMLKCSGITKAREKNKDIIVSSATRLFFDLCPAKIIGVTGSKGKGTTASLIYAILKQAGKKIFLLGNIGNPWFSDFTKITKNSIVVAELSSFQLEDLEKSPHIAVITNLFREHLAPADPVNPNYHKSFLSYVAAKKNIFKFQKKSDFLFINKNLEKYFKGNFTFNGGDIKVINKNTIQIFSEKIKIKPKLTGMHNLENICAAAGVAKILKIRSNLIQKAVSQFKALPYRLEFVGNKKNIQFYNDSFSTTPESSIVAVDAFLGKNIILISGGSDKGADFVQFTKKINDLVKYLVLLPGNGSEKIKKRLKIDFWGVKTMKEAVKKAIKLAGNEESIILLSSGCASFASFKNYKQRGNIFNEEVNKYLRA